MSIKEKLRLQMESTMPFRPNEAWESYKNVILERGRAIFEQARIPALFEELADIIRPKFQDVKIEEPEVIRDGSVQLSIGWNFRHSASPEDYDYNAVYVRAYPLAEELHIHSENETKLLVKPKWSSDPNVVEDAIAEAYRNPVKMRRSPLPYNLTRRHVDYRSEGHDGRWTIMSGVD